MPQDKPLISVLLPVYNENPDFLHISIDSILNQTLADFELLVLDDGSTSATCLDVLREYEALDSRIQLFANKENLGITKTLNFGLAKAQGTFIARQDSDDVSEKNRFEKQHAFMQKNPACALCGSWANVIDESGKVIGKQEGTVGHEQIKKSLISMNSFVHTSWFFRKAIIDSVGGYNQDMPKAQDYDLLLKLATKFPIDNIPEYLCSYRMNNKSVTFSKNKVSEKYALESRFRAIREYDYPKSDYLKILRPAIFYYLVPTSAKKLLMRLLWKI